MKVGAGVFVLPFVTLVLQKVSYSCFRVIAELYCRADTSLQELLGECSLQCAHFVFLSCVFAVLIARYQWLR